MPAYMNDGYRPSDPNSHTPPPVKPKRRHAPLGCGIILVPLVLAAFYILMQAKHWHPADDDYPMQGIDVSHHQGPIEWSALPDQGVDFAYIKATEGGDFVDPAFATNWQEAGRVGIPRGAYHFFTLCRPGREQAANVIANVPADATALPLAVDLEFMGNCSSRPAITDVESELSDFLSVVERHYQQKAVLYLTEEFDDAFTISAEFDRPLWLRSIGTKPDFGARPWTIWQVSNFRQLDGIEGRVDWNVVNTGHALEPLGARHPPPPINISSNNMDLHSLRLQL